MKLLVFHSIDWQKVNRAEQDKRTVLVQINRTVVPLKLDTRAKTNLMNELDINEATKAKSHINLNRVKLKAYKGQHINAKGMWKPKLMENNTPSCF